MRKYFTEHTQFFILIAAWIIAGIYTQFLFYAIIPASLFLLKRKEMYSYLLLGFLFILITSDSTHEYITFGKKIKELYILVLTLIFFTNMKDFRPFNKIYLWFFPFFISATISLYYSDNFFVGLEKTISYFFLFMIVPNYFIKCYREKKEDFLRELLYFGGTILLAGFILIPVFPNFVFLVNEEGRYMGLFGNPNGLGIFSVLYLLLLFTAIEIKPALFNTRTKYFLAILAMLSILICGSRTALLAAFIFFLFRQFFAFSPFLGFIVFMAILVTYEFIFINFLQIITFLNLEDYFRLNTLEQGSGRLVAWEFAWSKIQGSLMMGNGFNYTANLYREAVGTLSMLGHEGNAHNSMLTLWLDTGLVGIILYYRAYLFLFIKGAKRYFNSFPVMFAILFSTFLESWLTASLNPYTIIFLMILTLLTDDEFIEKKENTFSIY